MTSTLPTDSEHLAIDALRQEGSAGKEEASAVAGPAGAELVVCADGPLLLRGDFEIVSTSGEKLPRRRKTVALCRCGASGIKPYCDGTHKLIGFRTDPEAGE